MSSAAHVRRRSRALAAGLVATMAGLVAAPPATATTGTSSSNASASAVHVAVSRPALYASDVQTYVNAHRRRAGSAPVALQWQLNQAAQNHANDMARRRYMSHGGSDSSNAGTRVSRSGYRWWIWGENVAAGQTTASQVVWAWLNSPSHRAVMLDRRYKHMGLGRAVGSNGVTFWCLVLASPR